MKRLYCVYFLIFIWYGPVLYTAFILSDHVIEESSSNAGLIACPGGGPQVQLVLRSGVEPEPSLDLNIRVHSEHAYGLITKYSEFVFNDAASIIEYGISQTS